MSLPDFATFLWLLEQSVKINKYAKDYVEKIKEQGLITSVEKSLV